MTDAEIRKLAHQYLDGTGDHCIINFARALIKTAERAPCAGLRPPCKFDCPCFFEDNKANAA